jgi:hypothetical protein
MPLYNDETLSGLVEALTERVRALEAQLVLVSRKCGVPYTVPVASVPEDVVALVEAGDRLGAIKRYRELTGADVEQARDAINRI